MTNINQTNIIKLVPKCLVPNPVYAYSATGYILPCCYADNHNIEDFNSLMKDNLLIDNIENINDIINSNEWLNFFKLLKENPENAPRSCKYYCRSEWNTKKRTIKKNI